MHDYVTCPRTWRAFHEADLTLLWIDQTQLIRTQVRNYPFLDSRIVETAMRVWCVLSGLIRTGRKVPKSSEVEVLV
jgi:hypothetical protein